MNKTGAWLVRYALEQLGVKYTFGIPGVHNTEIYDQLNESAQITPYLVSHEMGAACMADAVSRTGDSIGCLVIVPAAGVTHAASGIGEAMLAGIPLLVIAGGIHTESGYQYQLHDIDQHQILKPLTKATYKITRHDEIVSTLFDACKTATSGEPGPVFVEVPVNIQLFQGKIEEPLPTYNAAVRASHIDQAAIDAAANLLLNASNPGLFVGWGAVDAREPLTRIAELLAAPVATTLQGLSAFPANHPLHTGMGFGLSAVEAAQKAFAECDCMLAVGTRFAEIATGSYGALPPDNLIHVDINPEVFDANYPATIKLCGDARQILDALADKLQQCKPQGAASVSINQVVSSIAANKQKTARQWRDHDSKGRVNPALFFSALRSQLDDDAILVTDDGNHTFLAAELMPVYRPRSFISPTDFNAMGYCVPAANGAKLANPDKQVVGIIGDGAMLMTGNEALTAAHYGLGVILCVFNDGELSQISQGQEIPYRHKTCTEIGNIRWGAFAEAMDCGYIPIRNNGDIETGLRRALETAAHNHPVIVDVHIDYSKRTQFTQGAIKANLARFGKGEKFRFISRALIRRLLG